MPKVCNLCSLSSESSVPEFRVPSWLQPSKILLLIQGEISSDEESDEDESEGESDAVKSGEKT